MTSGIGDIFGGRYQNTPKEKLRTIDDFLGLFADKPLEFTPGTKRQYSNGGYVVLGAIIEKVSGRDCFTYIRNHIHQPAGMTGSDSYDKDAAVSDRAIGYTRRGDDEGEDVKVRRNNYPTLPGRGSSAGGGYSTAEDLLRFVSALRDGNLWSPELSVADGFAIAGGAPGLNAEIEWTPERGYTIIVLSNYDPPSASQVAAQIKARLPQQLPESLTALSSGMT
jgi:D-alanyl-D-alanine carboxypeptidase